MKRQSLVVTVLIGALFLGGIGGFIFKTLPVAKPAQTSADSATIVVKRPSSPKKTHAKSQPQTGQYTKAQALAKINALMVHGHVMGTLLVTNNGLAGVKTLSYGYADVASGRKNSANEVYPLASLQKALTATVIQSLINQGKLTMATPLSTYFPKIRYAKRITIRDLLDHTSGIRMGEPVPTMTLPNEAAEINFTVKHLKSTNNHAYAYSNANFTLLAGIIRKATGKSYMANLQADVLKPLKMHHTYAYNQVPINVINPNSYQLTNGYSQSAVISKPLQSSELGCGSLYASVGDYYKFINALFTGKLVGQAGFNELSANQKLHYAAGIYYFSNGNVRIGGNDNSFHTYYMGTTDGQVGVVLFDNQGSFHGDNTIGLEIQAILQRSEPF